MQPAAIFPSSSLENRAWQPQFWSVVENVNIKLHQPWPRPWELFLFPLDAGQRVQTTPDGSTVN